MKFQTGRVLPFAMGLLALVCFPLSAQAQSNDLIAEISLDEMGELLQSIGMQPQLVEAGPGEQVLRVQTPGGFSIEGGEDLSDIFFIVRVHCVPETGCAWIDYVGMIEPYAQSVGLDWINYLNDKAPMIKLIKGEGKLVLQKVDSLAYGVTYVHLGYEFGIFLTAVVAVKKVLDEKNSSSQLPAPGWPSLALSPLVAKNALDQDHPFVQGFLRGLDAGAMPGRVPATGFFPVQTSQ